MINANFLVAFAKVNFDRFRSKVFELLTSSLLSCDDLNSLIEELEKMEQTPEVVELLGKLRQALVELMKKSKDDFRPIKSQTKMKSDDDDGFGGPSRG